MPKRSITIDDLFKIKLVSDPQISPDGKTIAFVLTTPDLESDKSHTHIWLVPADGALPAHQFTFGAGKDRAPRWSPDGKWLAFLSDREQDQGDQLYLMALAGGEARRLTTSASKPSAASWSPDGALIAFTAKVVNKTTKKTNGARADSDVKAYTRLNYKSNDDGFWDYGWRQVFVTPTQPSPAKRGRAQGEARQLTRGDYNHGAPAWSPDGKTLVFAANRTAKADDSRVNDLWTVPARGGALKRITRSRGPMQAPTFSPDGKWIAYVGHNNEFAHVTEASVYVMPARGGAPLKITGGFDRTYGNALATDLRSAEHAPAAPRWSRDGKTIYFLATDQGANKIYSVPARGGTVTTVVDGAHYVAGFSFAPGANRFALALGDALNPNDIFSADARGKLKPLTRVNADALRDVALSKPERFVVPREDGWAVEGWLMKPVGWKAGRKYPAVLEIHGGPHSAYGAAFFHEFQLLCARGYAVIFANPRGGAGYGQDFAKSIGRDWGGGDYRDLMATMDYALAKNRWIDARRIGVAGGSYGGYMTSWIVTHTDRFRAAVSMRALNNFYSFYGTSDIGHFFATDWYVGGEPWNNADEYLAHSPIAHVANCKTPTLILHSEKDYRCPIEQGEQFYIALKKLGVPTKFVRFPDETHELSRSGKPKHRKERLEHIVEWFGKYLK